MLNTELFGEKLRNHRKNLGMTQEEVAEKIGVSAQAVSKWEAGDCLPDCFNLKALGEVYKVSLDILLQTETAENVDAVAAKIEQLGDEFIWAKQNREKPNAHRDLGEDLWKMWKGLYFIEAGNREVQERTKSDGNLRVCSQYGMKIWDDDGVACLVKSSLREKLHIVEDRTLEVMRELCTKEGFTLISILDTNALMTKAELVEKSGIELHRLNALLLLFTESKLIEFMSGMSGTKSYDGYKMCARSGVVAYMMLAAAFILAKQNCHVSEYLSWPD